MKRWEKALKQLESRACYAGDEWMAAELARIIRASFLGQQKQAERTERILREMISGILSSEWNLTQKQVDADIRRELRDGQSKESKSSDFWPGVDPH